MWWKLIFAIFIFLCIYFLFKYLFILIFLCKNKKQIGKVNEILNNTQKTKVKSNEIIKILFENYIEFNEYLEEVKKLAYNYTLLFKVFGILGIIICIYIFTFNENINIYVKIFECIIVLMMVSSGLMSQKLNTHIKKYLELLELINLFFESQNLKINIYKRLIISNKSILAPFFKSSNDELINLIKEYNQKGDKNDNK